MASFVETTAISLRKGDTTANMNFTGILGEITADLGYTSSGGAQGTDINTTLRLHNGVTKGGIPMCRADTRNITSQVLAENRPLFGDKNLAYADLSNIEKLTDAPTIERVVTVLTEYGLNSVDNMNETLKQYALADMSNVLTNTLANNRGTGKNGNLAYADTTNINTADLVDITKHNGTNGNGALAYADMANVDTTNLTESVDTRPSTMKGPVLAKADLSNVSQDTWSNIFFDQDLGYELETTRNKDADIPAIDSLIQDGHYPETKAVKRYVDSKFEDTGFLTTDLMNIKSYEPLYATNDKTIFTYVNDHTTILKAGTNFMPDSEYFTGIWLANDGKVLSIIVDAVDANGYPTLAESGLSFKNGDKKITSATITSDNNKTVTYDIVSTLDTATNLYTYKITAINLPGNATEGGFIAGKEYTVNNSPLIIPPLTVIINSVTEDTGAITSYTYSPESGHTYFDPITLKIYSASNTEADLYLSCASELPKIGGAGLLKLNLTNLPGMDDTDKLDAESKPWRINYKDEIPTVDVTTIEEQNTYNLATIGQVWEALRKISTQRTGEFVHTKYDETINGTKTFTVGPYVRRSGNYGALNIVNTSYDVLTIPTANQYQHIVWNDKNNKNMSYIQQHVSTDGTVSLVHAASNYKKDGTRVNCAISAYVKKDGTTYTSAPTPPAGDNSTKIATTNWCYDPAKSTNLVHRTGNETIAGTKTFTSTINATALYAQYADLAEKYKSDIKYPIGTLIQFGGEKDITVATTEVNGVISEKPALVLNKNERGQAVALAGKTKVRVLGKVNKFDKLILSNTPGIARVKKWNDFGKKVIAIALETNQDTDEKLIMSVTKITF